MPLDLGTQMKYSFGLVPPDPLKGLIVPTVTFEYASDAERLSIETAIAYITEMHQLARTAPAGQVLSACEEQALEQGRHLLRSTLQQAVQAHIDEAEQKGGPRVRGLAPLQTAL